MLRINHICSYQRSKTERQNINSFINFLSCYRNELQYRIMYEIKFERAVKIIKRRYVLDASFFKYIDYMLEAKPYQCQYDESSGPESQSAGQMSARKFNYRCNTSR